MQFRIIHLLAGTAFFAVVCAGLVRADWLFNCLAFSLVLLALLTSALCAIAEIGESRMFWLGFLLAGGSYLIFAHSPDADGNSPRRSGPEFTTLLLRYTFYKLHPTTANPFAVPPAVGQGGMFSIPSDSIRLKSPPESDSIAQFSGNSSLVFATRQRYLSPPSDEFMRIGHSAWTIIFGWLGGQLTRFVYRRSRRRAALA